MSQARGIFKMYPLPLIKRDTFLASVLSDGFRRRCSGGESTGKLVDVPVQRSQGAVREAGALGRLGAVREDEYFHKQQKEQVAALKKGRKSRIEVEDDDLEKNRRRIENECHLYSND